MTPQITFNFVELEDDSWVVAIVLLRPAEFLTPGTYELVALEDNVSYEAALERAKGWCQSVGTALLQKAAEP